MSTLLSSTVHLNPDVIFQRMEDDVVLLHAQTNRCYNLNKTAARLWELLSAEPSLSAAQQQMLSDFDVEATQLAEEITALVTSLHTENLIKIQQVDQ